MAAPLASHFLWLEKEEHYLRHLQNSAAVYSAEYSKAYNIYERKQRYYKIPPIILGTITGTLSVGTTSLFPEQFHHWVPVAVGGVSVAIAIISSIESYLKIPEMVATALTSYKLFQELHDDIERELGIPNEDRSTSGVLFLRDAYTRYQQILGGAPPLEESPFHSNLIKRFIPNAVSAISNGLQSLSEKAASAMKVLASNFISDANNAHSNAHNSVQTAIRNTVISEHDINHARNDLIDKFDKKLFTVSPGGILPIPLPPMSKMASFQISSPQPQPQPQIQPVPEISINISDQLPEQTSTNPFISEENE